MCSDEQFDPDASALTYGPINKPRWIYACSKQLMDRVIWGYGMEGLNFTLFRPFNWIGPGLDSIYTPKEGSSRVVTQFLGHIVRGENISLVDGGSQKRAFTDIGDGISALMKIIENKDGVASGKIYNIGNPKNNFSVRELAHKMLELAAEFPEYADSAKQVKLVETTSGAYYGNGYRTCRTACRRSTTRCRNSAGRRKRRSTTRCATSSKRIAATSPTRARSSNSKADRDVRLARIVLKIDVDSCAARAKACRTSRASSTASTRATFLFSLARSHGLGAAARVPPRLPEESVAHVGGRALRREAADVRRAAASPDIGRRAIADMRAIHEAGFECGIHTWDHVYWQDNVRARDRDWTAREMQKSHARFIEVFGAPPVTHGAAGWQMNDSAFEQIDAWGCATHPTAAPFAVPAVVNGRTLSHVQMPTTLPTLDEVLGIDGVDTHNVAAHILKFTETNPHDQVFTLRNWKARSSRPCSSNCSRLARARPYVRDDGRLPRDAGPRLAAIVPVTGEIPGRSGELIVQPD